MPGARGTRGLASKERISLLLLRFLLSWESLTCFFTHPLHVDGREATFQLHPYRAQLGRMPWPAPGLLAREDLPSQPSTWRSSQ